MRPTSPIGCRKLSAKDRPSRRAGSRDFRSSASARRRPGGNSRMTRRASWTRRASISSPCGKYWSRAGRSCSAEFSSSRCRSSSRSSSFATATRWSSGCGRALAFVAATTVRGVVIGILGTALAQGCLMAIGLWLAGIKAAPLLGLVTFFLSPVPIGPPLVWIAAGIWLIVHGDTGWGIFLFAWGALVVSSVDNFIKPLIISRGSDLPFILVLLGVLGGAFAFGFIGVFLGPVLLAVGYALLKEWAVGAPRGVAAAESASTDT